jgi:ATP/maltotriose-dependent transcriptional regulator MalT
VDSAVSSFSYRSWDLWLLGYPEAALSDADQAVSDARQLDQAATLIYALASVTQTECGNYATASAQLEEATALAEEKGAAFWKGIATMVQGRVLALTGDFFKCNSSRHVRNYRSPGPILVLVPVD